MVDELKLVKDLRDKTGAGFLDCKQALASNNGNIDEAVSFYKKAVTLNPSLIDYFENKRRKLKEAGLWNASNEREKS